MELEEIHSLALSPAVATSFSSLWSDDDKISVITEKGLYIMEVLPDASGGQRVLELCRSWVQPSDYFPTSETGIDCNNLVWKLDQQDAYKLILDTYLAPNLTTTKSLAPYITQAAWSSAGMLQYGRCLLASLTNYGCVQVHVPRSKRWFTVVDISSLWSKHCSENWADDGHVTRSISVLQSRVGKLKATAITWTNVMSDGKKTYSCLVVGLLNGDIVLWRLNAVPVRREKSDLQPQILLQFETKMHNITTLHWRETDHQTGWLCVGDVRGTVKMLSLSKVQDELQCVSSTEVWPYSDRIQVIKLVTLPCSDIENCPLTIIAIKGSFVIAVALDMDGTVVATYPYLMGNLSVTGVVVLDHQRVLVLTHTGSFNVLRVVRTGEKLSVEAKVLSPIKIPKSAYYGIAASTNKAIFCLVTSFCVMFDHLVQRDPAQLTFFKLCGLIDPYTTLLTNPSQSLGGYWDCLELIRLQGSPVRKLSEQLDNLTTYHLKMHLWLRRFALVQGDPEEDPEKQAALKEELKQMERLILNRHVCEQASQLMKQKSLTNEQQQSLGLQLSWLQKVDAEMNADGPTQAAVRDIVRCARKFQHLLGSERCSICDGNCDRIENATESQCPAGHSVPRCCMMLLQCSDIPFWICRVCHSIAHTSAGLVEAPVCVYCDTVLYLDDRLVVPGTEEKEEQAEQNQEVEQART